MVSQQKVVNRFPSSVFIKLHHTQTVEKAPNSLIELPSSGRISPPVDVQLTIRFGKQSMQVPGGIVWFGLKRGELKLTIHNGEMPIDTMGLSQQFEPCLNVTEQQDQSQETEVHAAVGGGVKQTNAQATTNKTTRKVYQVSTAGTEKEPIWIFAVKTQDPTLEGQLSKTRLGTILIGSHPCQIRATFEVRKQDIHLIEASGLLLPKDIGRCKTALLERAFCLRHIFPKLQPHLSFVEKVL